MKVTCPTCSGIGRTLQDVLVRDTRYGRLFKRQDMRRCPSCFGIGRIAASRPEGRNVEVVASDVGLTQRTLNWRKLDKFGMIHGLPRFAGHAFATDGILVAIRLSDGQVAIGHLDSFVENKPASEAKVNRRMTKLERLAAEFA
jgi:hypothetical protein